MLMVELAEVGQARLVLFPHCLGQKCNGDQTLNQPNKVWHDRRPVFNATFPLSTIRYLDAQSTIPSLLSGSLSQWA
jgi:hypothetical protein